VIGHDLDAFRRQRIVRVNTDGSVDNIECGEVTGDLIRRLIGGEAADSVIVQEAMAVHDFALLCDLFGQERAPVNRALSGFHGAVVIVGIENHLWAPMSRVNADEWVRAFVSLGSEAR